MRNLHSSQPLFLVNHRHQIVSDVLIISGIQNQGYPGIPSYKVNKVLSKAFKYLLLTERIKAYQ